MKAKEAFAGRKVRCPQCDKVVRIPRLEHHLGDLAPMQPPKPAPKPGVTILPPAGRTDVASHHAVNSARPGDNGPASPRPISFANASVRAAETVLDARPTNHAISPAHPWVDQSLDQQSTPWLPGDEERFQKGIKSLREGLSGLEKVVICLVLFGGAGLAGWLLLNR
jgi:hypothetical protein